MLCCVLCSQAMDGVFVDREKGDGKPINNPEARLPNALACLLPSRNSHINTTSCSAYHAGTLAQ